MHIKTTNQILAFFKSKSDKSCLVPDCNKEVVKSHSIPNKAVLQTICDNGHVFLIEPDKNDGYQFRLKGINLATTFTGYCCEHDSKIFRPIDFSRKHPFNVNDNQQLILMSLRALGRECWCKTNAYNLFKKTETLVTQGKFDELKKNFNIGDEEIHTLSKNYDETIEPFLLGTTKSLKECTDSYNSLWIQVRRGKYHLTKFKKYIFDGECNFSVNSVFNPEYDFKRCRINDLANLKRKPYWITLNIFPYHGFSYVIFAYHRMNESYLIQLFSQIDSMDIYERELAISKIALKHCENIVFRPSFISSLSTKGKSELLDAFQQNILDGIYLDEMPKISFFANKLT